MNENEESIQITGDQFTLIFNKSSGAIQSLKFKNTELIRTGLVANFWRAPTDNDLGYGMPKLHTRYTVYGDGSISLKNSFRPGEIKLPELPRFGMTMTLPGAFKNLSWYGRGPHESYWDRKTGAAVSVYSGRVWEQYHPYVRPQETGNKTDVRWLALWNEKGVVLLVVGQPLLSASAYQFLNEDLRYVPRSNRHGSEVKPRELVTLNLDYKQMGVGGDTSWGDRARPHPEYTLPAKPYVYSFRLQPLSLENDTPMKLSKLVY